MWRRFELVTWEQEMATWEHELVDGAASASGGAALVIPAGRLSAGATRNRFDAYLIANMPRYLHMFVGRWGKRHSLVCRQPGTCKCYVLDGHMKCFRNVCANKFGRRLVAYEKTNWRRGTLRHHDAHCISSR